MTVQVGLIGLGAMGLDMAQSLRRAGHTVHVYDVRAEAAQAFAKDGGVVAASPAALGAACDVLVSVVVNAAQTESVLFGPEVHLIYLKSTNVPQKVRAFIDFVSQNESSLERRVTRGSAQKEK